jgi:hypothetical protein
VLLAVPLGLFALIGCNGGGPAVIERPSVDPQQLAAKAIEVHDANKDGALAGQELASVPAIERFLADYDTDGNKQVSKAELTSRFERVFAGGGALSVVACTVTFNGRPLGGAEVVFEPEPFLGEGFKTGRGTTDPQGMTSIAIPDAELPESSRGFGAIYNGLYKVKISHPQMNIPEAYQGENTVLGYEISGITDLGTRATFILDSKGTKPK